jgi:hypothetical protein
LPDSGQRKIFKDKIEAEASDDIEKKYVYYYENRGKKKKELRTIKGIWADKFYTLRNHIIHGLKIPNDQYIFRKNQTHTDIALLFFLLLIKAQINKSLKKGAFSQRIDWEKFADKNIEKVIHIFKYYPY